ncbi:hypothetical protein QQS21_005930 [Conoideocrella luteorostrata]|uniref:C3H1-type domain-containing protein n=1 Tax=Conoideocrella luteorostrata TaxID=1105319 RepID=A0AAJ0CNP4_9HYPO|nr:hypothetical protein QQS21_005930 [Conoideocrella luteorostrata]
MDQPCAYYLDRGGGQYTRLIPADMLSPIHGIPQRVAQTDSMIILPVLSADRPASGQFFTFQDSSYAPSRSSAGGGKIYCDKWIHDGVCAFTQQGCKFKHEMPSDEATQRSLGLYRGLPPWWKQKLTDTIEQTTGSSEARARSENWRKLSGESGEHRSTQSTQPLEPRTVCDYMGTRALRPADSAGSSSKVLPGDSGSRGQGPLVPFEWRPVVRRQA